MKSRTSLFVIGIMIAMLAASLLTVLVLFLTGTVAAEKPELVFAVNAVAAKEYDGTPLKAESFSWVSGMGELQEGHRVEGTFIGEQTDCGTSQSGLRVTVYDEKDRDVTNEYSVTVNDCELTVVKKDITIVLNAAQIEYCGKEIPIERFNIYKGIALTPNDLREEAELPEGQKLVISFPDRFENVGDKLPDVSEWKYENFIIYDTVGNKVTHNYQLAWGLLGDGDIEIVPRRLKIKVRDAEKYYDGKPLAINYDIISGSLVEGHFIGKVNFVDDMNESVSVIYTEDSTLAKVDSIEICKQVGYDLVPIENAEKNYILEGGAEVFGSLTVNPRPITVSVKDLVKIYDGDPLSSLLKEGEKIYETDLPAGYKIQNEALNIDLKNVKDVCDKVYSLSSFVIKTDDENGYDVTSQFAVTKKSGVAKISPVNIRIQPNSPQVVYSGEKSGVSVDYALGGVLSAGIEAFIASNGDLSGKMINQLNTVSSSAKTYFKIVGAQEMLNIGSYPYAVAYTDEFTDTFGNSGNVVFEFSTGVAEVTKLPVTVTYNGVISKVYDGTEASPSPDLSKFSIDSDLDIDEFSVSSALLAYDDSRDHILVGTYTAKAQAIQIVRNGADVTNNLDITPPVGIGVTITPCTIRAVPAQAFLTQNVPSAPTYDEGQEIAATIASSFLSAVSFPEVEAGGGWVEFVIGASYDDITRSVVVILSEVSAIYNSDGDDVTNCYTVENVEAIISTVQFVVIGA